jgi:hypothetical protein
MMLTGVAHDFRASPENEIVMRNVFRDMELSIGKFASRSEKFTRFVYQRPEYPVVLTSVPFTAVTQILFMVTHSDDMFEPSRCRCAECWNKTTRNHELSGAFSRLLSAVASKYGRDKQGFLSLARQVISKIVAGQRTFLAVYIGNAIGPKRLRKLGVCLYPGWDGELVSFRTTRAFEFNQAHAALFPLNPFSKCIFFTFSEREMAAAPGEGKGKPSSLSAKQMLCPATAPGFTSSLPPSALCDKILQRAHEYFSATPSSPPPAHVLERIYFMEESVHVTVKVRRVRTQAKTCHYEIFILKGEPYTNLDL